MYVLIKSLDGTLNNIECRGYANLLEAQTAMETDFLKEYKDFYETHELPRDEDNDYVYIYGGDRAVLCLDEPDTPEWAIEEMSGTFIPVGVSDGMRDRIREANEMYEDSTLSEAIDAGEIYRDVCNELEGYLN